MVRGTVNSLRLSARLATTVVLLLAFGTSLIFGQGGTASILGVVRDTTGALVPGVTINVRAASRAATLRRFFRWVRMRSPH